MNNPLKLFFLIFNLVPSLTSSVNNFSQSLSESELQMGQNASQIVERGKSIIAHGAYGVNGVSFVKNVPFQRKCTLSFPVIEEHRIKGFLTSMACVTNNVFVGDTEIGEVQPPYNFDKERGLDYAFVKVYFEFWSDDTSNKISYS